ncbi:hypothetical protein [Spongiactinospora sp. TRM90649]|uniref:endonuclease/exonuclease/phosphatase family protein n=1 Tax=Spongiactinospora sp. TRM90649 TaxID=3031114 RepID=UPI0023F6F47D|nr:hypothetical protein [Spongiactinospora sp. TRM90649]MDF5754439.1 hypothetical protein [Spongiactinospora sp. TRM90649]
MPYTPIARRRSVIAAAAAASLALLTPQPATAATFGTEFRVLQLNLCHSGVNTSCFTGDRVITKARSVITSVDPAVLSLNEICSGDVAPLREAMGSSQVVFKAAERPDGSPVKCVNGQDYGNALMVDSAYAGTVTETGRYAAQDGGSEKRVWACVSGGAVAACTTHLSTTGSVALNQCRELMNGPVTRYAAGRPAVMSGDLNMRYQGSPNVQNCVPSGFFRKGDGSVQHVTASTRFTFVGTRSISMSGTTDHPAWQVTLSLP